MDRRSFVKGCVAAAGAAVAGGTVLSLAAPSTIPRAAGVGVLRTWGSHRIGGPAPRGIPLIPIALNDEGFFEGRPTIETPEGEANVLDWYKYCQHQNAPGLRPNFQGDNVCRYFAAQDKLNNPDVSSKLWFKDQLGQPIRPADFSDPEALRVSGGSMPGASFVWRSQGQSGTAVLTGAIVRMPRNALTFPDAGLFAPAKPLKEEEIDAVLNECVVVEGDHMFLGVSTFCSHFCCTPGWKETEGLAKSRDAWDDLFCTCHFSIYNPREIVAYDFVPELAAELEWPNTV